MKKVHSKTNREYNIAYIDGQNLHLGTSSAGWQLDFRKFRIYLKDKFKVQEAYYFLWYLDDGENELYTALQKAWFILIFREHSSNMKGKKKWNVDVDICFEMMRSVCEEEEFDHIVLVTGDGDYIKPVKYLIEKWRFKKILFPNKMYSSLYRQLQDRYSITLSVPDIKKKIEYIRQPHKGKSKKKENMKQNKKGTA